ncbi:mandelate racemase/muconate lactonizing enzyme family protein [Arhodomonas aquaeolei]|uniref:mandelate racemase/muconate lactonizing enzyme family protein n=1 Tax=Arhodomonas aquaeolei TaxID=2369 RepID=UPI002167505C|nr:mandelate racemase/muconate lactonizing enzyme family protein [Arhodomonas aquaeolei]MCS4505876.1 mandelate racemase/muconate lactonizing enzyme family protein [Arhodomonas aquaeolei]
MNDPQMVTGDPAELMIDRVDAFAVSFPIAKEESVTFGAGRAVKRDAVVVRVTTREGIVGWGEAHHGRAHTAIAELINTTLADLVVGMDAADVVGAWQRIYRGQLASMGTGTAAVLGMSGIDMALWDIRGKALGWPLYRLLGGRARAIPAYAGGVALGWQPPEALAGEAGRCLEHGYRALKLRLGDTPARDIARVQAVRAAVGDDITLMADANTAYSLADARRVVPALDELGVAWLEEPFTPDDRRAYATARGYGRVPFAAGENHYTRFAFTRLIEEGAVDILQPDLSKTGGITEAARVAALAAAHGLWLCPHSSMTGLNMAASIHFLAAQEGDGYFEGDASLRNRFRDEMVTSPFSIGADGCVRPLEAPGIGVMVNEEFLAAHPPIPGPAYVR